MVASFHSLERQDEFVYALFGDMRDGFFLDVSCQHPIEASNTCFFEQELGWSGLGFDWVNATHWTGPFNWEERRPKTKFIQMNVLTEEFTQALLDNVPKDRVVDYISLDVDTETPQGHINLGWQALTRMINGGVRFKVMTLEHEFYTQGENVRFPTRLLLESLGYRLLFPNVLLVPTSFYRQFEDWWIHPKYFRDDIGNYGGENLDFNQCIERIKGYKP